jgi:hypothetical protein
MTNRLRHAKELKKDREQHTNNKAQLAHEQGLQRATKEIEEAHGQGKNRTTVYPPLPESVLHELRTHGYGAKRVPPGEFAAMGTTESIEIWWD